MVKDRLGVQQKAVSVMSGGKLN